MNEDEYTWKYTCRECEFTADLMGLARDHASTTRHYVVPTHLMSKRTGSKVMGSTKAYNKVYSPLASNKVYADDFGRPYRVVIETPDTYPFGPGERERDWHVASDQEWAEHVDYYNHQDERDEQAAIASIQTSIQRLTPPRSPQ